VDEENEETGLPPVPGFMTGLAAGAAAHHELYKTYIDAGFPELRAFQILQLIMWHGMLNSASHDGSGETG
jgi:hypothetical protein